MNTEIASGWITGGALLVIGIVAHRRAQHSGRWNTVTTYGAIVLGVLFGVGYLLSGAVGTFIPFGMTVTGVTLAAAAFHRVRHGYIDGVLDDRTRWRELQREIDPRRETDGDDKHVS